VNSAILFLTAVDKSLTICLTLLLLLLLSTDAPPQLPSWMSEEILRSLSNVLLELPFSRRAETEADLIGEW
jgi:hypothetical protein